MTRGAPFESFARKILLQRCASLDLVTDAPDRIWQRLTKQLVVLLHWQHHISAA
jgi:hypothetical protein